MEGNQKKSILENVIRLFVGTVLSRGLNAAALIVLAQYLNSRQYGMFSVALAFSMVMGYFTDAGLSNTVLREGSRQAADIPAIISSYVKLRILLLAVTFLGGCLLIQGLYGQGELAWMTYCLMLPMVLGLAMQSVGITYFQLIENMQYVSAIRIWSSVFLSIMTGLGLLLAVHPYIMSLLFGLSYVLAGLYGMCLVHRSAGIRLKQPFQRGLMTGIGSFLVSGLLIMLLPQLGPLMLEQTLTLKQVGLFAVAQRIPSALYQVPGIIGGAFYPVLFQHHHAGRAGEHLRLNILQIKVMGLLGLVIAIPLFHLSDWIVWLLFGGEWTKASGSLQLLSLLLVLQAVGVALADGLTTQGLQGRRTIVQCITVIAGAALYGIGGIQYGVKGAVYAALAIEMIALLGFWAMSPGRAALMKRVLLPYLPLFALLLWGTHGLLAGFPAAVLSVLLLPAVLLDREMREAALRQAAGKKVHSA